MSICSSIIIFFCRSYSTLSIASSRSSLASDLRDVGTPPPSSPLAPPPPAENKATPPADSFPLPPENPSEDKDKQRSHSPTPQPEQLQGENRDTAAPLSTSDGVQPPPEINVETADSEWVTIPHPPSTTEELSRQLSLSEAGAQVEASEREDGEGEGTKKEDDFGDFQGVEGVVEVATTIATAASSNGDSAQSEAAGGQSRNSSGKIEEEGSQENHQEADQPPSLNPTDTTTTNLQTAPNTETATGMLCGSLALRT